MKYVMRITEMLTRTIIVDAEDWADARDKTEKVHNDGQVVLGDRDYNGYEIDAVRIAYPGDLERYEEVEV